ncbi:exo-alpha-sialidase [Shewanella sp. Scap07]|uniref:exo-alpha-sialidase n=1 Tax=Shewanella sp. Scap07 TaxID=2589987 RepID=UPI0015BACD3D|nr:exo-alpha-sialidase [Shewanella sp. Scap07]QLE85934.1 exo-alpha-sialidase [Shewanella sp. Scap07]
MQLISVSKIWDAAEHNAFTDLVRFNGDLYTIFREGEAHVCANGSLRLLRSVDEGDSWQSVHQFSVDERDLRDGKLLEFQGQLLAFGAGPIREPEPQPLKSFVWHSDDGETWSAAKHIAAEGEWLWRVSQYQQSLYGVAYHPHPDTVYVALYQSDNGMDYHKVISHLNQQGYVNESGLSFVQGVDSPATAYCLLRRDPVWSNEQDALLGVSTAPFTDWQWQTLDKRIGGPVSFVHDAKLYAVVRLYDGEVRTSVVHIDTQAHQINELLTLPSGGDTSYAGVVLQGSELLISYYSSHEGQSAIYFARVALAN